MAEVKIEVNIEEEMKRSYIDYAMSVIIGRALPDIRDGLKPVHRRVVYAMYDLKNTHEKPYKKSARIVGDVIGKYHPHGDTAVYDAIVRMAQDFSMRYPLIDGQGNFGSLDGDSPAAMRYTEIRLHRLAEELLSDIEKETVDFGQNYDESLQEPLVLPTRFPNLLLNGSSGIAVGMATNIPPHNLEELIDALILLIGKQDITVDELMEIIPGPDFPTGGFVYGKEGIVSAYKTGRGIIQIRARAIIEKKSKGDRESIVITETPYQVNKAKLMEKISELVREKRIDGISEFRDESDRDGTRIVIDLKKDEIADVVLNQLYKHTQMQVSFGIILLTIDAGQPRILDLKTILEKFVDYRKEVVIRKTRYDLRKAEDRSHILQGLKKALENLDEIISIIRGSKAPKEAKESLMLRFKLSEKQSQAILDMRLQRLTALERERVLDEHKELLKLISNLKAILNDDTLVLDIIVKELDEIKERFGNKRRTEIIDRGADFSSEDLIIEENMVVAITHRGYIKRNPTSIYRSQKRGGKGLLGIGVVEEDFVEHLFVASTHDYLLIFTGSGKMYWLKVHEIPQAGRMSKGKAIVNLLNIEKEEKISAILPISEFKEGQYVVMATRKGIVKKTPLLAFSHPRSRSIIAMSIEKDDCLISAHITSGSQDIFLGSRNGKAIRFHENELRPMGRQARGVKGISTAEGDEVVGMEILNKGKTILTVTENGYGKRTPTEAYRSQKRGGMGVITIRTTDRNGRVVVLMQVDEDDGLMLITDKGRVIRINAMGISVVGRSTQGVKLIGGQNGERVVDAAKMAEREG
jgi:DNA gyrase subunit A